MVNTKGQDVVKIQKNYGKEAGTAMTAPQKIHAYEYGIMFLLGCFIYSLLEIAARGYTHHFECGNDKRPRQRLQQQRMPWSCAM